MIGGGIRGIAEELDAQADRLDLAAKTTFNRRAANEFREQAAELRIKASCIRLSEMVQHIAHSKNPPETEHG